MTSATSAVETPRNAVCGVISASPARISSMQRLDGVDGDGEADALAVGDDRGVDADHGAVGGDERPTRVAGVDGGIGLDEVAERHALGLDGAVQCRDDAPRDRGLAGEVQRVADGDDLVAHLQLRRVAERRRHHLAAADLDEGDVVGGEAAHQLGRLGGAVGEPHRELVGVGDDVGVGEDQAVVADDHAGAGRLEDPLARGAVGLDGDDRRLHDVEHLPDVHRPTLGGRDDGGGTRSGVVVVERRHHAEGHRAAEQRAGQPTEEGGPQVRATAVAAPPAQAPARVPVRPPAAGSGSAAGPGRVCAAGGADGYPTGQGASGSGGRSDMTVTETTGGGPRSTVAAVRLHRIRAQLPRFPGTTQTSFP